MAKIANNGARPAVEITAQIRPKVDCEMPHKPDQWSSRKTRRLESTCCANEEERTVCSSSQMQEAAMVAIETSPVGTLERNGQDHTRTHSNCTDGRKPSQAIQGNKLEMAMLGTSKNPRVGEVLLQKTSTS